MWPGQQPGDEQPPQQNPYRQPGPYDGQGYGQPGPQQQGQWGPQLPPGAPRPARAGTTPGVALAIVGSVAAIAALAVTGVVLLNDDDDAAGGPGPAAGGESSSSATRTERAGPPDDPDNPRAGGDELEVEPVVPGWKAVYNPKRHDVFDVPPEWEVQSPSLTIGFEDKSGQPLVSMTGAAMYKDGICKYTSRGGAGTKGGVGAKNTSEAAENEAGAWASAAYNQSKKATIEQTEPEPFTSEHGLRGHMATATATNVPKDGKCAADGRTVAFTYADKNGEFATWVLYADTGVEDAVPDETIAKIMDSLRPLE